MSASARNIPGRGAANNPGNRFERLESVADDSYLDDLDPENREGPRPETVYYRDATKSIITTNTSPDVGFDASINPYRGCQHGCVYCFARPNHEYLGLSAGLDFETKILVKENAPELLRRELSAKKWRPRPIALSVATDCYQTIEKKLKITRRCLEVLAEFRNPVAVVTKNHLVTRDVDLLQKLAKYGAASVSISLTTLDDELRRRMEPRTSSPRRRLAAMEKLSEAGIPVSVLVAPVIPGLTDHELPNLLRAAADAGATSAGFTPVRLPHAVAPLFAGWLQRNYPDREEKVLNRIREIRNGKLNDPRFGSRMRGEGVYAEHMRSLFDLSCRRAGISRGRMKLSTGSFRVPTDQPSLFD
ncbi:PA0069 family radical SAM protein [Rubrobacter indicoceani]|uniref:PA0069 family radical SAM protein n=1 Tax=Rubrobacter indicoceani TaxID=2051957 RepID=UPI000E5BD6A2|nr:PA0069 family radical SAM protein [Rubrobacter indicoceani]